MIRFFANANYDFMGARRWAYGATAAVAGVGLLLLAIRGLNESIEFTGGTLIQVTATSPTVTEGSIRAALDAAGLRGAEVQTYGAPNEFVIRTRLSPTADRSEGTTQQTAAAVDSAMGRAFGANRPTVGRFEAVGPKVGGELRQKALLAILFSFGATLIYLWFRFEWRFGLAAVAATAHDIILTVAFIAIMHLEVSLVVVAAILTIVGYSLNDTIIIFDRVRENLRRYKRQYLYDVLNLSVNQTLPRSILTHGTTAAATIALLILAGEVIRPFAWVMSFGIITGTFSSVYIASPLLMIIERRWPGEDARGARGSAPPPHGGAQVPTSTAV
jgi:preprotein translocase SecF subunit